MANPKTEPESTPHPSSDISEIHWNLGVSSRIPDWCLWGGFVLVGVLLELLCCLAGQFLSFSLFQPFRDTRMTLDSWSAVCQCWWCISNVGISKDQNHFKTRQPCLSCAPEFPWKKYRGNQVKALRGRRGFRVSAQHSQESWRPIQCPWLRVKEGASFLPPKKS